MAQGRDIRSLTGVRGIAACLVVLYHFFGASVNAGPLRGLLVRGYIAVDLFFVLSGFVLAYTYAATFLNGFSRRTFLSFLYKRLGRIYPLYAVVTLAFLAAIAAGLIDHPLPSALTTISNLLLVQSWGVAESVGGPTWSISTEFALYLLFPAIVVLMLKTATWMRLCSVACALAALLCVALASPAALHQVVDGVVGRNGPLDAYGPGTIFPLLRCFGGFVLGVYAYWLSTQPVTRAWLARRHMADLAFLLVAIFLLIPRSDVAVVLLFVPLIVALSAENSFVAKWLGSRIAYWLGQVSYSIYLVHHLVDDLLRRPFIAWLNHMHVPHAYSLAGVPMLAVVFGVATLTYYGVEKPARDASRQVVRRVRMLRAAA